eukprot:1208366-Amphidinium_carterae.1
MPVESRVTKLCKQGSAQSSTLQVEWAQPEPIYSPLAVTPPKVCSCKWLRILRTMSPRSSKQHKKQGGKKAKFSRPPFFPSAGRPGTVSSSL